MTEKRQLTVEDIKRMAEVLDRKAVPPPEGRLAYVPGIGIVRLGQGAFWRFSS